jgi:metal-responsive CopG/Arc/MetJ family transcriptional regulator
MTERLQEDLDPFTEEHGYTGRSEVISASLSPARVPTF